MNASRPKCVHAEPLAAIARCTGWPDPPTEEALKAVVNGPAHDGLDAYMSAWVAALEPGDRRALGRPPDDAIWVPSLERRPS